MALGNWKFSGFLIVMATFAMGVRPAEASLITWEFAGEISIVADPNNELAGAIVVGSPFSVSFTYESTTPDRFPDALDNGSYIDAIKAVSGQVGGISVHNPEGVFGRFSISNNPPAGGAVFDSFSFQIEIDETSSPVDFQLMDFNAVDMTGTMFSNDSLPLSPPSIDMLDPTSFILSTLHQTVWVRGELTSITPEPTSLVFFAIAGALACRRKPGNLEGWVVELPLPLSSERVSAIIKSHDEAK